MPRHRAVAYLFLVRPMRVRLVIVTGIVAVVVAFLLRGSPHMKGSIVAIAFGLWFILVPRSVIWFYGDFLGGRMEKATPRGIQVAGALLIFLIIVIVAVIDWNIIA